MILEPTDPPDDLTLIEWPTELTVIARGGWDLGLGEGDQFSQFKGTPTQCMGAPPFGTLTNLEGLLMKLPEMRYGECRGCGRDHIYVYTGIEICNTRTEEITSLD